MNKTPARIPLAYHLTIRCYGTLLPGEEGWISRSQNEYGSPLPPASPHRAQLNRSALKHRPYYLDLTRRKIVAQALHDASSDFDWTLVAFHVRTVHFHQVIRAACSPEFVLTQTKATASRLLNEAGIDDRESDRWVENGSKKYLWTFNQAVGAIDYVLNGQGAPMQVFPSSVEEAVEILRSSLRKKAR